MGHSKLGIPRADCERIMKIQRPDSCEKCLYRKQPENCKKCTHKGVYKK